MSAHPTASESIPPARPGGSSGGAKRQPPAKFLPTDRIVFSKQLDILAAYASVSGPERCPVTNEDVRSIVEMATTTVAMTNAFFVQTGFLSRVDGGYLPAPEVFEFGAAAGQRVENATRALRPIVERSWFARRAIARLRYQSVSEADVIADLTGEAKASDAHKFQVAVLLNYLEAVGLATRSGGMLQTDDTTTDISPGSPPSRNPPNGQGASECDPRSGKTDVRAGGIDFQVSIHATMEEISAWPADRIAAFFKGIGIAIAAQKGQYTSD